MQSPRTLFLLALVVPLLTLGCQSSGGSDKGEAGDRVPAWPKPEPTDSIGYFLTQYDKTLKRWHELKLGASNPQDLRALAAVERNLAKRARERSAELLLTLESGPPTNRQIAAVALGFTDDEAFLGPLVAALSDRDPNVVQKALIGLGVLGREETPLAKIQFLLTHDPDAWTRNNAAYVLARVVAAGARDGELEVACRDALVDEEAGVRAQCASVLGMISAESSIQDLGDRLYDEVPLVASAAATALTHIGSEHLQSKGRVARLLVDALERAEDRKRQEKLLFELTRLSGMQHGEETNAWKEWAYRLP